MTTFASVCCCLRPAEIDTRQQDFPLHYFLLVGYEASNSYGKLLELSKMGPSTQRRPLESALNHIGPQK